MTQWKHVLLSNGFYWEWRFIKQNRKKQEADTKKRMAALLHRISEYAHILGEYVDYINASAWLVSPEGIRAFPNRDRKVGRNRGLASARR